MNAPGYLLKLEVAAVIFMSKLQATGTKNTNLSTKSSQSSLSMQVFQLPTNSSDLVLTISTNKTFTREATIILPKVDLKILP